MTTENPRLIVAGGGTGGHVLAGVAVADTWKNQMGGKAEVSFVGASGGIEEKLVPRAGYNLELLHLGSLNRVSTQQKIKTMLLLPLSIWKSIYILLVRKPDAVLGVGGYASGPLVLTAKFLRFLGLTRAKTAILEQNSIPGMTNRMLGRWVDTVFCAFPGTEKQFPTRASSVILTGNPVRSSMELFPSAPRDPFTVFIFGGSQGALGINSLLIDALPHLGDLKSKLRFVHQTGERDYVRVKKAHEAAGTGARVEKFVYDMPEVYRQSSLLICRAGSSTLSEIATVGRAAILVPFPQAADNHQEKNARVFSDAGAALLMLQDKSKGEDLARLIRELVENPTKIDQMEKSVTAFYRPKAASDIVAELLKK
jgi:UDP-N-acetylglucosamine--N-acetylmuramyl-(pentapeptide) pyrophosphoryl-undecaprenol N-acetylglucosamine transferase